MFGGESGLSKLVLSGVSTRQTKIVTVNSKRIIMSGDSYTLSVVKYGPARRPNVSQGNSTITGLRSRHTAGHVITSRPLIQVLPVTLQPPFLNESMANPANNSSNGSVTQVMSGQHCLPYFIVDRGLAFPDRS